MENLIKYISELNIEYIVDSSLATKTWIHRGPIVPLYVIPKSTDELVNIVRYAELKGVTYKVIGHTSNLYFLDTFEIDMIISISKLNKYSFHDNYIICECGVNVSRLSKDCVYRGYCGFEGLVGLPGTVAGAVVNNSSCYNCSISDLLVEVEFLSIKADRTVQLVTLGYEDLKFKHRSSALKENFLSGVILSIRLLIKKTSDVEGLISIANSNIRDRAITQESKAYNLGSVFSAYNPKRIELTSFGTRKIMSVFMYKLLGRLFANSNFYRSRRISWILNLYGYEDLVPYISKKNINCFLWKKNDSDCKFERYLEFMHSYAECGKLEIEILR